MKQKFIVKHLASTSPLVCKLLEQVANNTRCPDIFTVDGIQEIYMKYAHSIPKSVYDYYLDRTGNSWQLFEDDDLVLHLELIEIYELAEHDAQ